MTVGEGCGEDGTKVGDDVVLEGGRTAGSKSRSGIGGETNGCCVIFKSNRRREALIVSMTMMDRHLTFSETFRRKTISITSSRKRIISRDRAAHL